TSTFTAVTTVSLAANTTTYADTTASPSTTYYLRVKASNGAGSSAYSNVVSVTTPAAPAASAYATAVAADNPTSWWRFGEASGTTAADGRGTNTGTYTNGPTLGQASLLPADTASTSVRLDGTNDYVNVPSAASLNLTNAFSIEAWIRPSALPAAGSFASVLTKAESYSIQLNGPRLEFTIMQSGARRRLQAPAGAVVAGTTYHVVATYDGTTQRLYVNGAQVASAALSGGATVTTSAVRIGSWDGGSEFFNGMVDEVALYSTVLTATQVANHNTKGRTG
ncbi:MAG: hypothetical protein QOD30_2007, partial [Actinomycetota bacterium]|nr:hypothetical protein [Actinomycetota bacterium]